MSLSSNGAGAAALVAAPTPARGPAPAAPRPRAVFVGLACVDYIAEVPRLPAEDAEVRATGMRRAVGGNSANSARAAAALGLDARLFAPFASPGTADPSTAFAIADLAAAGVRVVRDDLEGAAPIPTSFITVAADTGSRTIVSCKDSGYRNVTAEAFTRALRGGALLGPSSLAAAGGGGAPQEGPGRGWIHFEGRDGDEVARCVAAAAEWRRLCASPAAAAATTPTAGPETGAAVSAAEAAAVATTTTTFSLELEKVAEGRLASLLQLVPLVDVVFVSSEYARGLGCENAAAGAAKVAAAMGEGGTAVCAFGAEGAACATRVRGAVEPVAASAPARRVTVVDSVGAGDTFNAAFIAAALLAPPGESKAGTAERSLRAAVRVATEKCTHRGFDGINAEQLRDDWAPATPPPPP